MEDGDTPRGTGGTGVPNGDSSGDPRVPTSRYSGQNVTTVVETYVMTVLGFAFTFFFMSSFVGGPATDFLGELTGGAGVTLGFGLSILLSPFVAVVTGQNLSQDDGGSKVVDSGLGAAVGFIVMFFTGLVLVAALGGSIANAGTSLISAGALVGLTIGNGLTGAGSAFVSERNESLLPSVEDDSLAESIVPGASLFLVFGVGYTLSVQLAIALGPGGEGAGAAGLGFGPSVLILGFSLLLAPLVAIVAGWVTVRSETGGKVQESVVVSGLSSAIGVVFVLVFMILSFSVAGPEGSTAGDLPLGALLGFTVGSGLTGAGSGFVFSRGSDAEGSDGFGSDVPSDGSPDDGPTEPSAGGNTETTD